jgi:tetratricopeptide (TPR) repeat protein
MSFQNKAARALVLAVGLAGLAPDAAAQEVAQATGKVVDREGNPVPGVVVVFRPKSKPEREYRGETDKKGRYSVAGLWTPVENELWLMSIEAGERVAVEVRVESRTVNRVLIGDVMTTRLKPGQTPPGVPIRPLGTATVDWVVAPKSEVAAEAAIPAPGESGTPAAEDAAAQPARDPWEEALTLAQAGELEASLEHFAKAVEQQPQDAERHETYAKVLYQLERFDQAEIEGRKALELAPSRLDSHILLFNVYDGRGELDKARQVLEVARATAPNDRRVLERVAYLGSRSGNAAEAIGAYEAMTKADPDDVEAWLALGNLYHEAGRVRDSERAYQRVVEIDPQNAYQTYYNLGVLIMNRADRTEADTRHAIDAFRRSLAIKPDYANAHQQLGFALLGVGDKAGALEELQAYLRVNPRAGDAPRIQALVQTLQK